MCDDHDTTRHGLGSSGIGRRALLKGAAAAAVTSPALSNLAWAPPAAAAPIDGAHSMAMHIHASFSELYGSMNAQLFEATTNAVDVIWWSEHDSKMKGANARQVVHFTSLTDEQGDGAPWNWQPKRTGSLRSTSGGGIVPAPASPLDPVPEGSLRVTAQSPRRGQGSWGYQPGNNPSQQNWRMNLTDQTLSIEVLPTDIGVDAYLEVLIMSSYHPPSGGRAAGEYAVSYRFGGPGVPGPRVAVDRTAVVTVGSTPDRWNSEVLRPDRDLGAVFPDLDSRDFSLYALRLSAVSNHGAVASGYFDYLRFTRGTTGEVSLQVQDDLIDSYRTRYPQVTQHHGLEASRSQPHVNWYGGNISLPDYTGVSRSGYSDFLRQSLIPDIHRAGGLASYNHPFGTGQPPPLSRAEQDDRLRVKAAELLQNRAVGADILEVGYPLRSGVDLDHHIALWDVCSRNAVFLTGNGVSDDHAGTDWTARNLDWTTSVWADRNDEPSLLAALQAGRAWSGSLSGFRGALDLLVDGSFPMGSATVSRSSSRRLAVTATDLPVGGTLEVVQGVVDYAGPSIPTASTRVVASTTARGQATINLKIDTSRSSFTRAQVRDSTGALVALSNPVWLLRTTPQEGIPAARAY